MLFIFKLWLRWVFVALLQLFSSCSERGAALGCGSRASYCPRAQALGALAGTPVPCTGRWVLIHCATREVQDS